MTGVVVTEGDDTRGICRRAVLRTGLAAVAAVASGCASTPRARPDPPGMRITGSDGFSGLHALGTYTIARGGTYGPAEIGDRSNHPNATGDESGPTFAGTPLYVATIEPVTIEGVHLKSTVPGVVCIYAKAGANVTVRNCYLDAYVRNGVVAWFNSSTDSPSSITFENNYVHGGTIVVGWWGGTATLSQAHIRYNHIEDIYGRLEGTGPERQAIQFHDVYGPNIDISWNQIVNHWQTSCVEDVITFYADPDCRCGGTAASRAQIHDNMIDGGWPGPGAPPNTYAGAGSNVDLYGDGYGAFADFHNNQYVALCNTGAAVSAGQSSHVYNNRVVCSGRLPDDSGWAPVPSYGNGMVSYHSHHSGPALLWDGIEGHPGWGDIKFTDNVVGFQRPTGRSDWWFEANPDRDPVTHTGNVGIDAAVRAGTAWYSGGHASDAASEGGDAYTITNADQDAERSRWQKKVTASGHLVGPAPSRSGPGPARRPRE
jgi:hypothetical protein